jgi:NAD(P)-dependent dehydrogenase (short-subunit alcohol dehydrogenase family)
VADALDFRLVDRVAIATGAAPKIGRAIGIADSGAAVGVVDRDAAGLAGAAPALDLDTARLERLSLRTAPASTPSSTVATPCSDFDRRTRRPIQLLAAKSFSREAKHQ